MMRLSLSVLPEQLAVCHFNPDEPVPHWLNDCQFYALTRTPTELSIVAPQASVPPGLQCESDWRCLAVEGPLDFALVGILANLAGILAQTNISLFAISTFDTDYLLVKADVLQDAVTALQNAGHKVRRET